jgi:hypothetical protein
VARPGRDPAEAEDADLEKGGEQAETRDGRDHDRAIRGGRGIHGVS